MELIVALSLLLFLWLIEEPASCLATIMFVFFIILLIVHPIVCIFIIGLLWLMWIIYKGFNSKNKNEDQFLQLADKHEKLNNKVCSKKVNYLVYTKMLIKFKKEIKPSEIIKAKLLENGGSIVVQSINGKSYNVEITSNHKSFKSKLYNTEITSYHKIFKTKSIVFLPYDLEVFDVIVKTLIENKGKINKNYAKDFNPDTVIGTIEYNYFSKETDCLVQDSAIIICLILEWAEICNNFTNYIELNQTYYRKILSKLD